MNIQRVFGCGIDRQTFKTKYEGLPNKEKLRLERVARRLWLTLKLRYEVAFYRNPITWEKEGFTLTNVELPSIEIYLLCTCLDTLAGKPTYVEFGEWVKSQESTGSLDKNGIINLYNQYKDEYGIGKNFRNLFINLPPTVKTWLSNNISIHRSGHSQSADKSNPDLLMKHLYTFFYEVWRNTYTHSSVSQKTSIADDIVEPTKDDASWSYPPAWINFVLYRDKPKQKWDLTYRTGLDLATILRLIINTVALQILKIDVTQESISTNLRNFSRLSGLYAFASEVASNSETLRALSQVDEHGLGNFCNYLIYVGIPLLQSTASVTMLNRYNTELPLEASLHKMTTQYLTDVNKLNIEISNFNTLNPPPEGPKDNSPKRLQNIREFLEELLRTPVYQIILNGPPIGEMSSVWLVIRDPCYT